MKYDLTKPIVDLDGNPIKEGEKQETATVYKALTNALMMDIDENRQPVQPEAKIKRFDLLMKIRKQDEVDLDVEEVAILSRAVLLFPTLVAGQLRAFLNQKG